LLTQLLVLHQHLQEWKENSIKWLPMPRPGKDLAFPDDAGFICSVAA
jgi:hypothetical protein